MLPADLPVSKGMKLVYEPTGQEFIVLCSCPNSRPLHFTSKYIKDHRDQYSMPGSRPR